MFGKGKIIFSAEPIELYIYFQYYKISVLLPSICKRFIQIFDPDVRRITKLCLRLSCVKPLPRSPNYISSYSLFCICIFLLCSYLFAAFMIFKKF